MRIHCRAIVVAWGLGTVLNAPALAQRAEVSTGYWDLFCVNLNKGAGQYWEQVNGGTGALSDPLVAPDPSGAPVISLGPPLGGISWGFGGAKFGDGVLESFAGPKLIELKEGPGEYHLSFTLDSKTSPQADINYSSWGTYEHIVVRPFILVGGANVLGPAIVPVWELSPFSSPVGSTIAIPGLTSTIMVATTDFGDLEGLGTQDLGIWGAATKLPVVVGGIPVHGWHVEFELLPTLGGGMHTWDSYNLIPSPGAIALMGLGLLLAARRRR